MGKDNFWMPFYAADYVGDTLHLSQGQHGAYILLITHYWLTRKPIPNDRNLICRVARATCDDEVANALFIVANFFECDGAFLSHKRLDLLIQGKLEKSEKASSNGSKGGLRKAQNKLANATISLEQNGYQKRSYIETNINTNTQIELDHGVKRNISKENPPITPPKGETHFATFWLEYPNRKDKQKARKAWVKGGCDAIANLISQALAQQKKSEQWLRDGGKFIPMPSTWLNGKRWEDEVTVAERERKCWE